MAGGKRPIPSAHSLVPNFMKHDRLLESERLVLRPLIKEDAGAIFPLFKDEQTIRYWNTHPHQEIQETTDMIAEIISRERSCYWAICTPSDHTALGYVGYVGNPGTPALVYVLAPAYRGKGLATEAIKTAVGYGFDTLKLDRIEAWIHPDNIASINAAGRVGFTLRGRRRIRFVNAAVPHDLLVYGLEAAEWLHVAGILGSGASDLEFYALRVVLAANSVEETLTYYKEKLGFDIEYCYGQPAEEGGVSRGKWSSDSIKVHFVAADDEIGPSGFVYFVVGAALAALYEKYQQRGVQIDFEPRSTVAGGREFQVTDLNGHKLRFGTL